MSGTVPPPDFKQQAKRLRQALSDEGIAISHARALELVARQVGARDWNTLAATSAAKPAVEEKADMKAAPFSVGSDVEGTFNGNPVNGRVIGVEETIKRDLWRVTVAFDPPVDVVTSPLFSALRTRLTTIVGADGRSRRLTGTETGVMALRQR
ncbi:hypothetical protein DUT91_18915 [Phyllobacterium salinisoli]|uniref:Glyoxalase-related protein domain-containing protein n=2 Tax=Phyllobacterium salinisoli TaxID=1899321 RepID=A0A368JZB3_9HYPH|nr:hypothetical protein DUT91_18915 [Phyllobacterium salinisoli]